MSGPAKSGGKGGRSLAHRVAARALGLGTTFTTLQIATESEMRQVLGIPAECSIAVCIALGHPDRPFGPVKRKPVSEVLHWDRW